MIFIETQNYALVNVNQCKTITIGNQTDEHGNVMYLLAAEDNILGYYQTLPDAVKVFRAIKETISNANNESNMVIEMPVVNFFEEQANAKND